MEDNKSKSKAEDVLDQTNEFMSGLKNLVEEMKNDLPPEQRVMVEKEVKKLDTSELMKALDDLTSQFGNMVNTKK